MKENNCISAADAALHDVAERLLESLLAKGMTVSTAESCTGGWIAKSITDLAGSSAVFYGACVTYTNAVKCSLLGIDAKLIARHTEVSRACAEAMAQAVRQKIGTDIGISTTGYAGPTGGSATEPVGTVYIGISTREKNFTERFSAPLGSNRETVRALAAARAMELALQAIAD